MLSRILIPFFLLIVSNSVIGQSNCAPNGVGTNWHNAAHWDCGHVPITSGWPYDNVNLTSNMTITSAVTLSGCCASNKTTLTVQSGVTLTITGVKLTVTGDGNGGKILLKGGGTINSDSEIEIDSRRQSVFENNSTFNADFLDIPGDGLVDIKGDVNVDSISVSGTSVLTVSASADIDITGGISVSNSGGLNMAAGGTIDSKNYWHSGSVGAQINGEFTNTGIVSNTGSSTMSGTGNLYWGTYTCSGTSKINCTTGGPINCPTIPTGSGINLNTCGEALLADVLFFNGEYQNPFTHLNWVTTMEENNDYFIVEKSYDMNEFYQIGTVKSNFGNSHDLQKYFFDDPEIGRGEGAYYWLKSVDRDGVVFNHQVIYVSYTGNLAFSVFPNPVADGYFLVRSDRKFNQHQLKVFNELGQLMYSEKLLDGDQVRKVELNLIKGVYLIQIIGSNTFFQEKLLVSE